MASIIDNIANLPDIESPAFNNEADAVAAIERYISNTVNSGKSTPQGGSLLDFFRLAQNAIWSRQATENIQEDKRLLVLGEDPPEEEEIDSEAITFSLENRESGQWSQGSAGSNGIKEAIHHHRSIQQHPEHLGEKLITMGRFFDNIVKFHVYARSSLQAMKRALWLENVMDAFRWYFRLYRINTVYIRTQKIGKVILREIPLNKYSVSFFVRTEDTYQFGLQELKKVVLNVDIINKEG